MRSLSIWFIALTLGMTASAQTDRGTITGTISDPAGAVIANATVEARSTSTGAVYQGGSSNTGNYTLAQMPAGTYDISITVSGFKKFLRPGIILEAAQTVRVDAVMEVGSASESVTVQAEAPLLKTESGELSTNVTTEALDKLPVLGIGSSASAASGTGLRNPYAVLNVLPGADWRPDSSIRINGTPSNTMGLRIEGQEASTSLWVTQSWTQPSVDAVQEFAIQTSNYAAEYGQAGGGVFNLTMRGGTNQYHGSAYDYFGNEALNAGVPFTNDGNGHLLRPRVRRNDYGFTFGGPVWIPKVYNGHDKTFFFFNFEQFRETQIINNQFRTVPTPLMHAGNMSEDLTNRVLGTDPLGRPVMENMVYDPNTDRVVNGLTERDPFPNDTIPASQWDPVGAKIISYMPLPNLPGTVNNYLPTFTNPRVSSVPSVKIDQSLTATMKLSGYWSRTSLNTPAADGMPFPITSARGYDTVTNTVRVNYDYTVKPTVLLHLGAGLLYQNYLEVAGAQGFHPSSIGLHGQNDDNVMPTLAGLSNSNGGYSLGIGPFTLIHILNPKPTGNASLTWVRGNHTYKFGGDLVVDGFINQNRTYAEPWITFAATETTNPALNGQPLPGTAGFGLASLLLGRVDSGYTSVFTDTRLGKHSIAGFAQDSWKVTRRLTLDYGLRYDFQTYYKEEHGLQNNMSPITPNPCCGNIPGGTIFEATCNCSFSHNYPYALGPRLGLAFQVTPKTVFRAGIGVSYGRTAGNNFQSYAVGANTPYSAPAYGQPAYLLQNGLPYHVTFPNFDPGQQPYAGIPSNTLNYFDRNGGRPPRMLQWSIGVQREVARDLVVEAAYVGNRGVWWQCNACVSDNGLTASYLAARGIDVNNAADLALLTSPITSPQAVARGFTKPYPSFPSSG
ncbi:MAG: TonB-dependent receptor, partial [Acidobacteriia bacterium]|nr:TonB-dependent receptor [Terriglobia bacterium]